jgi:hypothetical protein
MGVSCQSEKASSIIATSADGNVARPDGNLDWLTERPAPKGFYGLPDFERCFLSAPFERRAATNPPENDPAVQLATITTHQPSSLFSGPKLLRGSTMTREFGARMHWLPDLIQVRQGC